MDTYKEESIMSDRMTSIPFGKLMNWVLTEAPSGTIFGVHHRLQADPNRTYTIFDRPLEMPFGPAAGPHTQLAQNIAAGYAAGARFFELKTVQKIDGEDLPVPKPCIKADDECYNVEWSTELTVPKALEEYVKAWFLVHVMAVEYGLGSPDGMQFNMSVGYDLAGIQTAKIDSFIENLKDASHTAIFAECKACSWPIWTGSRNSVGKTSKPFRQKSATLSRSRPCTAVRPMKSNGLPAIY